MRATPILTLPEETQINAIFVDKTNGGILIGTSDGKIIKMDMLVSNAFLTGERSIYADMQDGFGSISDVGFSNLTYELKNQIIKINEDKEIELIKEFVFPISTSQMDSLVVATFTSPVLYGGDDFICWKSVEWQQNVSDGTNTSIKFRAGTTAENIELSPWESISYTSSTGDISVSLDDFSGKGSYIQFAIELTTMAQNISPSVYNLNIFYRTIPASFFFTQKFILKKQSNASSMMLIANVHKPKYTEVKFGVSDGKTTEWRDYYPIDIEKINEMPSGIKDRIKIGIKFISNISTATPSVDEFALMFKSEKQNLLNK